jgi:hypothetical protein
MLRSHRTGYLGATNYKPSLKLHTKGPTSLRSLLSAPLCASPPLRQKPVTPFSIAGSLPTTTTYHSQNPPPRHHSGKFSTLCASPPLRQKPPIPFSIAGSLPTTTTQHSQKTPTPPKCLPSASKANSLHSRLREKYIPTLTQSCPRLSTGQSRASKKRGQIRNRICPLAISTEPAYCGYN